MAKYNNEFLTYHLRDICALYIAQNKLSTKKQQLTRTINRLSEGRYNPRPEEPNSGFPLTIGRFISLFFGLVWTIFILSFIPLYINDPGGVPSFGVFAFVIAFLGSFGVIAIVLPIRFIRDDIAENRRLRDEYIIKLQKHENILAEDDAERKKITILKEELSRHIAAYDHVSDLLRKVYSINIIPHQYRTQYVAVYLYEYFEGSQENDLTMAINTFVLEEIKARLDRIIENQQEMLFNQYSILHNQETARIERQQNHDQLMDKLNRIEASNEEHNIYLSGMARSVDVATFYATWNFYNK